MPVSSRIFFLAFLAVTPLSASAQQTQQSDPQAASLVNASLAALTHGVAVNDVALRGSAIYTAGSDQETGTVTLEALGVNDSRVSLSLSAGERSEVRNATPGAPQGSWAGSAGVAHAMAVHNCWAPAAWFFPTLAILGVSSDPAAVLSYVGQETFNGASVQHVRIRRASTASSASVATLMQHLTTVDLYLDSQTYLPVALDFNLHPDNNANQDVPVDVRFSNYQPVNGALVPYRIEKFLNHSLLLDLTVQSVNLNSGLADSYFSIQ